MRTVEGRASFLVEPDLGMIEFEMERCARRGEIKDDLDGAVAEFDRFTGEQPAPVEKRLPSR